MGTFVTDAALPGQHFSARQIVTDTATYGTMVNRLREFLEKHRITQAELARRMEVDRQLVNKWCARPEIKLSTVSRIAEALGASPSEILGNGEMTAAQNKTFTPDINRPLTAIDGTIPVHATDDGENGGIIMEPESAREIERRTNSATYAIYAPNDSLRPSCRAGDILHVDSSTRPTIGRFALVLLHERDAHGRRRAILGEMVERTPTHFLLRHSHPTQSDITVDRSDVDETHAITLIEHA